jgi:thiamine pyrophosphokinase
MAIPAGPEPALASAASGRRLDGADAIVVANGDVDAAILRDLVAARPGATLIAADGGARAVEAAGLWPDLVVGDGDSLEAIDRARLAAAGVELRQAPAEKDESDTELCLLTALEAGATRIAVCGALGGDRPEHAIANLLLLADPRFDGREIVVYAGGSRVQRIGSAAGPGSLDVSGSAGDYVSLFPVGGPVTGVRTTGLRYPLVAETLTVGPARGLSNELIGSRARVATASGCLLVVITPRSALDQMARKGTDEHEP